MYKGKKVSLVIPAYNEEKLIRPTLDAIPSMIDRIYVIDDMSADNQNAVILDCAGRDPRIVLIRHEKNQGPGGAIITGYLQSATDGYEIAVVVGGDNQMPLGEIPHLLDPIVDEECDYTKGNRFLRSHIEDTLEKMPKTRLIGNMLITALTKIASGYYKIMDVVDGFTAISKRAIDTIEWRKAWRRYGYPMDFLVRLNAFGFKVKDVPRTAIYLQAERQSQIKGLRYALSVTPMLIRDFFWRLRFKYIYLDFHPLVFFYFLGLLLLPAGLIYGIYLLVKHFFLELSVTGPQSILCALFIITGLQFLLFAMLFDAEEGK